MVHRPYDLYIRYLFTSGVDDVHVLNEKLEKFCLDAISQDGFESIVNHVAANIPKSILRQIEKKSYSVDFMKWMRYLGVDSLWPNDNPEHATDLKLVYDIHSDKHYRLALQALLIRNVNISEIQQILAAKFAANYRERHLILFKEFFFDPGRMSREDWSAYLRRRSNQEKHVYFVALSEETEALKAELGLYSNISVSDELSRLLRKSLNKAHQYLKLSSKESNYEARAWISTAMNLADKYEKYRSADSSDFSKSLQMEFEYIDNEFPTPDESTLSLLNDRLKSKEEKRTKEDAEDGQ